MPLLWIAAGLGTVVGALELVIPWHRFHPMFFAALTPIATILISIGAKALAGTHSFVVPMFYLVTALLSAAFWPRRAALAINSVVLVGALWPAFVDPDPWYLRQLLVLAPGIIAATIFSSHLMERLLDERKERAKLSALTEASEVSASLDLEATLAATYKHLRTLVGAQSLLVYLYDAKEQVFVLRSAQHDEGIYAAADLALLRAVQVRPGESLVGLAAELAVPLLSSDLSQDSRMTYPADKPTSGIFVPLKGKDGVTAVMVVGRLGEDQFGDEDAEIVTLFARQAGSAIENARLFREAAERAMRLEVLSQVGQAVSASLDQDSILQMVGPEVRKLVPYDRFGLLLLDETASQYRMEVLIDPRGPQAMQQGQSFSVRGSAMELILDQRCVHNEGDLRRGRFVEDALLVEAGYLSCLRIPLEANGKILGMLALSGRRLGAFRSQDAEVLTEVARQVAVAIQNARLYRQSQERARTDPLTGLYNRRHFNEVWLRTASSARRDRTPLSLMLADVYDMRMYNEVYGQLAGDERLKEAAGLIASVTRQQDLATRFGGDEFSVIMPDTEQAAAAELEHHLQEAIARWNRRHEDSGRPPLLLSTGVVTGFGVDAVSLIPRADQAARRARDSLEREHRLALQEESQRERQRHVLQTVLSLAKVEEIKDPYTRGHSQRMRNFAVSVARGLGLDETEVEEVGYGAILHDIGKIAIPTEILHKPAKLTQEEMQSMRQHPLIGQNIIAELEVLAGVQSLVRHHHERYDGRRDEPQMGYPDGLKGEEIPLGARIIAVVDAYDAMTSDRPYRKGMAHADALTELRRHAGSQFDPQVVEAFIAVLESMPDESTATGTNEPAVIN
ncbi:MAG: HD domain-containing phosphohydrolase [Symbiobacteriia bacterium]